MRRWLWYGLLILLLFNIIGWFLYTYYPNLWDIWIAL